MPDTYSFVMVHDTLGAGADELRDFLKLVACTDLSGRTWSSRVAAEDKGGELPTFISPALDSPEGPWAWVETEGAERFIPLWDALWHHSKKQLNHQIAELDMKITPGKHLEGATEVMDHNPKRPGAYWNSSVDLGPLFRHRGEEPQHQRAPVRNERDKKKAPSAYSQILRGHDYEEVNAGEVHRPEDLTPDFYEALQLDLAKGYKRNHVIIDDDGNLIGSFAPRDFARVRTPESFSSLFNLPVVENWSRDQHGVVHYHLKEEL